MAKRSSTRLKLPPDVLGTLKILLQTPPPPAREQAKAKRRKPAKKRTRKGTKR